MEHAFKQWDEILSSASRLTAITEDRASEPLPDRTWSRKQVLGHLIDSAANNHQRVVRLQQGSPLSFPPYEQDVWVRTQRYQERPWADLVALWLAYNRHLRFVFEKVDPAVLSNVWTTAKGDLTLDFIIRDYVRHLKHHIDQVL